jgi:hypothetical protein
MRFAGIPLGVLSGGDGGASWNPSGRAQYGYPPSAVLSL